MRGASYTSPSILTQIRSGKIGLVDFLHGIGVPPCWRRPARHAASEEKMAQHVVIFCPRYQATRNQLLLNDRLDLQLVAEKDGVAKLTRWWILRDCSRKELCIQ
jgi:hypothetical protein